MATSATYCTFVVHPDGSDLNGGAFDHKYADTGTDASSDNSPICTIDGSAVTATIISSKVIELDGYDVQTSDIGNCLFGQLDDSGTTWIQSGPINSVDTVNNRWGWSSTQSWVYYTATEFTSARLGGALQTPGGLTDPSATTYGRMGSHSVAYIKAATYTMTSSDCESGGRMELGGDVVALVAYKTTPGDHYDYPEDRVIIDTGSTANDANGVIYFSTSRISFVTGFEVRGNSTWAKGFRTKVNCTNCVAKGLTENGFILSDNSVAAYCRAEDCGDVSGSKGGFLYGVQCECIAIDCSPFGFKDGISFRCVAHGGTYGFELSQYHSLVTCVADGCSDTGFYATSNRARSENSVAMNCATGATALGAYGPGNAFYNNTANSSDDDYNRYVNVKQLSSDPFNDAPNYDYTLNDTAGGGAELAERSPKFGAGVSEGGPQQQQSAQLKSTGSGSTTVVTPGPIQIGM